MVSCIVELSNLKTLALFLFLFCLFSSNTRVANIYFLRLLFSKEKLHFFFLLSSSILNHLHMRYQIHHLDVAENCWQMLWKILFLLLFILFYRLTKWADLKLENDVFKFHFKLLLTIFHFFLLYRQWTLHYQTMMQKVHGLILLMNSLNTWLRMALFKSDDEPRWWVNYATKW